MKSLQRFSEYSMSTYLLCARKYRYTYIEKNLKKSKKKIHVNFIFGNAVHLTCKDYYSLRAEERTLTNLHNLFRKKWKETGIKQFFGSISEERQLGERGLVMLTNFFNKLGTVMPYQTEQYMEHKIKDYVLFGRVDRTNLLKDDSLEIIDYKTTRYYNVNDDDDNERKRKTIQLKLYAFILSGSKRQVSKGSFYHMEDDYFDTIDFTEGSIKHIGIWFEEIINDIRYDKYFDTNVGNHCKYCDFFNICQGDDKKELGEIKNNYSDDSGESGLFT